MNRTRNLILTLTLATAVAATACQPPLPTVDPAAPATTTTTAPAPSCAWWAIPSDGTAPCGVTAPAPDAEGVLVVGDSITWQTVLGTGLARPFYGERGWQVGHVLPYLRTAPPPRLVVALGTNDSNPVNEGWNDTDVARWTELLALPSHVTVVLPAVGPGASAAHRAEAAEARAWIIGTGVPVVDWQPYANDPTIVGTDGIHLLPGDAGLSGVAPQAGAARAAAIEAAAAL